MTSIPIGNRVVGDGHPCFIVAEAGSNHNGSFEQAIGLIDAAADAGADAVKFQLFRASKLYPRSAGESDYIGIPRSIYDIIHDMEMPEGWLGDLAKHTRDRGLEFFAAPFDEESADVLDEHVDVFKIASYEMTHHPLLQHVARKGKPVILSTGTANLEEVGQAVKAFHKTANERLILLQCTAKYPTPNEALNVRALVTLREAFGLPTGLSDHSRDPVIGPATATALGANVIEKHFTLSNRLPGPDHAFAVEPHELAQLVETVRAVEAALGTGAKEVLPIEDELRSFGRRALFTTKAIGAGESFGPHNTAALRAGKLKHGLPPEAIERVIGRAAAGDMAAESPIEESDLA